MKGRLLIIIFISICLIAGSCNVSSVQGSRYNFSSLDSVIQGWVSKEYYPGASICVVKNDSVIFQKNYGSYTPDTKVYVASAGKWVAAAVIGAVVDSTSWTGMTLWKSGCRSLREMPKEKSFYDNCYLILPECVPIFLNRA